MPRTSPLVLAPPYEVEQALKTLGGNLRTARLRRNLSLAEVAARMGVERHVVGDAERGKPSTGVVVYAAMLWALGLGDRLGRVAAPETDEEGLALARGRDKSHAYPARDLDDDF